MELSLLEDPSRKMIETYLPFGVCRIAEMEATIVGVNWVSGL